MNLRLHQLILIFKQGIEEIELTDFNYFYGRMGAGKSSIARLIDFCLGGRLETTPALQSEFVSATLLLEINQTGLQIVRDLGSTQVRVLINLEQPYEAIIPVRAANGEVIPTTNIEVLSDLLFYLAGVTPPKVRKSKIREESDLVRLSFRDLFWYCYLDQDDLDSNFFNLGVEAHSQKRNKSRDVFRFIIGFHQERVTELEIRLEDIRMERSAANESARILREALQTANVESEEEIQKIIDKIEIESEEIIKKIDLVRKENDQQKNHVVEKLRTQGRDIANELQAIETAIQDVESTIKGNERYYNELLNLKFKFRRVSSAKAVLSGLTFEYCPRCTQKLTPHSEEECSVCGLPDKGTEIQGFDNKTIEKDADERTQELKDVIGRQKAQLKNLRIRQSELQTDKGRVDSELNLAMKNYDSAFLSQAIALENRKGFLEKSIEDLKKWRVLPQKVTEQQKKADELLIEESKIKQNLKEFREAAEKDLGNLRRLEQIFLDCLLRAQFPGYSSQDTVEINPRDFIPYVIRNESGGLISSFDNLGSGGKKALFKCLYAVAIHRLAKEIGAFLPKLLIIDSPMKNISERENQEQFESFHRLLYQLAEDELSDTQFIVIDKELFPPNKNFSFGFKSRHMTPFEVNREPKPDELPLIPYYKGH
jgi:hypothetical protein